MDIKHSLLHFCNVDMPKDIGNNTKNFEITDSCLIVGNKKS